MKEYFFNVSAVSGSPDPAFNQPLNGTLVLSDAAVAFGIAKLSDIVSLAIAAGDSLPDSDPMTLQYLDSTQFIRRRAIEAWPEKCRVHPRP